MGRRTNILIAYCSALKILLNLTSDARGMKKLATCGRSGEIRMTRRRVETFISLADSQFVLTPSAIPRYHNVLPTIGVYGVDFTLGDLGNPRVTLGWFDGMSSMRP